MMFNVTDGGIIEAIEVNKSNLAPDRSVIVMDEEKLCVWLWHGKLRGLVPRRMALRQAESVKGHGYQAGNAIVGRGLTSIVEIDDRKVGREPETTKLNDDFQMVLNKSFSHVGNFVYVEASGFGGAESAPAPKPKPAAPAASPSPTPAPKVNPTPSPKPAVSQPVAAPVVDTKELDAAKKKVSELESQIAGAQGKIGGLESKVQAAEADKKSLEAKLAQAQDEVKQAKAAAADSAAAAAAKPADEYSATILSDELKQGAMVIAVLSEYKDIWMSKKDGGIIAMEQMDGKICSYAIENGELKLQPESFKDTPEDKKAAIEAKYKSLIG